MMGTVPWKALGTHHTGSCLLGHLETVSRGSSQGGGGTTGREFVYQKSIACRRPGCCGPGTRQRLEHAKGSQWLRHPEAVSVLRLLREAALVVTGREQQLGVKVGRGGDTRPTHRTTCRSEPLMRKVDQRLEGRSL